MDHANEPWHMHTLDQQTVFQESEMTVVSWSSQDVVNIFGYAGIAGFVAKHGICTHDSWPENPAGEGTAETEVSPDKRGRMGKSTEYNSM